jgi:hypothetical protein
MTGRHGATKPERPAKRRPGHPRSRVIRDAAGHRGRYLRAYRSARAVLEAGVPVDQARRFFERARSLALWDIGLATSTRRRPCTASGAGARRTRWCAGHRTPSGVISDRGNEDDRPRASVE